MVARDAKISFTKEKSLSSLLYTISPRTLRRAKVVRTEMDYAAGQATTSGTKANHLDGELKTSRATRKFVGLPGLHNSRKYGLL